MVVYGGGNQHRGASLGALSGAVILNLGKLKKLIVMGMLLAPAMSLVVEQEGAGSGERLSSAMGSYDGAKVAHQRILPEEVVTSPLIKQPLQSLHR